MSKRSKGRPPLPRSIRDEGRMGLVDAQHELRLLADDWRTSGRRLSFLYAAMSSAIGNYDEAQRREDELHPLAAA